jgi:hypothetical protein
MAKPIIDYKDVLSKSAVFRLPRVVAYSRLESRPRTTDFTSSIAAEVRDPLWMLCRQWQLGEFAGEDSASPLAARIAYRHYRTSKVSLRDAEAFHFDSSEMPLETRVEREPIAFHRTADGKVYSNVVFATRWGKKLLAMLKVAVLDTHQDKYLERFPIKVPVPDHADIPEDAEARAIANSVARRVADGVAVWRAALDGTHDTWLATWAGGAAPQLKLVVDAFADSVSKSIARLFSQPASADDSAWSASHLEYQFAVGADAPVQQAPPVLRADQYAGGRLDWYSFDADMTRPLEPASDVPPGVPPDGGPGAAPVAQPDVDAEVVESFLPGPVRFKGQPQPRFWEMEEAQTDFGKIETSATGLLHLLLAEFGLIYSNDWFMLPHPLPVNTVCEVRGILIDDCFGRHTFIRSAGRGVETAWQRFAMFHLTERGTRADAAGSLFYLPAVAGKVLESAPLERVNFMRDEMANMVWAVEGVLASQTGQGMSAYRASPAPLDPPNRPRASDDMKISYLAGTKVPPNWTPFVPVHAENSVSEIRLQRARMAGGVAPLSRVLREPKSPYFVNEEEIPRTGILVYRTWQRVRWLNGRTLLWIGRAKTTGRGEGGSNLQFDRIRELEPKA